MIISLDDPHGLAIMDDLDDEYEEQIHHWRLYANLDSLIDTGLALCFELAGPPPVVWV